MIFCKCGGKLSVEQIGIVILRFVENGEPYYLQSADMLKCKFCGNVVYQANENPFLRYFQTGFLDAIEEARKKKILVNERMHQ